MMYHVVGIKRGMSFSGKDGEVISGLKLYLSCPDEKVEGFATDSFFISSSSGCYVAASALQPLDDIDVFFNRYGKIDSISKR